MLLSPRLQKLHVDSLVSRNQMVFLKTRSFVMQNNVEFTNVSSFTLLLMCSTPFTRSCTILPFSLPTTNFFKSVYSEITGESAWWVLFRPPWYCLLLWQMKVIRIVNTSILDFWYSGPSTLALLCHHSSRTLTSPSRSCGMPLLALTVPQTLTFLSSSVWANLTMLSKLSW